MRYLPDVINQITSCFPSGKHMEFKKELESIKQSAMFAAPEAMYIHWQRTYNCLCENTTPEMAREEWIRKIASIFSGESN